MTDIPWADWNGVTVPSEGIEEMARRLVKVSRGGRVMAGDTLVLAERDTDGTITLYDCQVRRVADVAPKETR